jgi:Skp family chaperone for outer membrane proteins
MRVLAPALALGVSLTAAPVLAQAPAPAPTAPRPAGQVAPAVPPAAQPAPPPRAPFQAGLKYAYVNVQEIAATSSEGKGFNAKVQALQEQKIKELQDKNKAVTAAQQKLEQGGSVMSDVARSQLQAEIERQQRDIQRSTEDAQQDVTALTQQLQAEFERRLTPVLDQVAKEKGVHFIFDAQQGGLVWADPTMDLTPDVIRAFDATAGTAAKTAAPAPAAAKPPAPASVPVKP